MNAELLRELARIARSSELHDLRVGLTPDETDALANMLEREHEEVERLRAALDEIREHLGQLRPCDYKTKEAAERMERAWAAVVKATEE